MLAVSTASVYNCCDLELHLSGEGLSGLLGHPVAKTSRKPITETNLRPWTPKGAAEEARILGGNFTKFCHWLGLGQPQHGNASSPKWCQDRPDSS